jgi:hypothetical protein
MRRSVALLFASLLLPAAAFAQSKGDRVLGRWPADGLWYPAKVQSVGPEGVEVAFDDGDVLTVPKSDLRRVDWKVGTQLQCNWKNQGKYFGGRIVSMSGETIEVTYDDGDSERITISRCRSS